MTCTTPTGYDVSGSQSSAQFISSIFHARKTSSPMGVAFPQAVAIRGRARQNDGMRSVSRSPIGVRMDQVLASRGWSQSDLARAADVAPAVLSRIVSGKSESPSPRNLSKIAKALGISQDWLATGEGATEAAPSCDPYPERARALQSARVAGLEPRAIAFVEALAFPGAEAYDVRKWLEMLMTADQRVREGKPIA